MSLPPVEIPLGAIRFNSDSNRLEYWNGSIWMQIDTFSPNLDGGARGAWGVGRTPSYNDTIDFITISTAGNATDFGNLIAAKAVEGALSSSTRGVWGGGYNPVMNTIEFITFSSTGNASDFGDITGATGGTGMGAANSDSHVGL